MNESKASKNAYSYARPLHGVKDSVKERNQLGVAREDLDPLILTEPGCSWDTFLDPYIDGVKITITS